ncbi:MAG: ribbon-helix-helix protein, CopG family [Candidatus Poribacteria bacterium]
MASVKTAISLQKPLLDQVDELAQKLNISRSHLFVLATEEFIKRRKAQTLLKAINDAYVEPDPEEQAVFDKMQDHLKKMVVKEKW